MVSLRTSFLNLISTIKIHICNISLTSLRLHFFVWFRMKTKLIQTITNISLFEIPIDVVEYHCKQWLLCCQFYNLFEFVVVSFVLLQCHSFHQTYQFVQEEKHNLKLQFGCEQLDSVSGNNLIAVFVENSDVLELLSQNFVDVGWRYGGRYSIKTKKVFWLKFGWCVYPMQINKWNKYRICWMVKS